MFASSATSKWTTEQLGTESGSLATQLRHVPLLRPSTTVAPLVCAAPRHPEQPRTPSEHERTRLRPKASRQVLIFVSFSWAWHEHSTSHPINVSPHLLVPRSSLKVTESTVSIKHPHQSTNPASSITGPSGSFPVMNSSHSSPSGDRTRQTSEKQLTRMSPNAATRTFRTMTLTSYATWLLLVATWQHHLHPAGFDHNNRQSCPSPVVSRVHPVPAASSRFSCQVTVWHIPLLSLPPLAHPCN